MKKDLSELIKETPSSDHKNAVFDAVQSELNYNKKNYGTHSHLLKNLSLGGVLSLAFAGILYFQFIKPPHKEFANFDQNLIMELATLSPDEVEVVEDLDFIDALNELSEEELEEITL